MRNSEGKLENIRNPKFSESEIKQLEDFEFNRSNPNFAAMLRI